MILDVVAFGSGIGLVMCGWVAGLVVSYVFNSASIIGRIGGRQ